MTADPLIDDNKIGKIRIISAYVPNGHSLDSDKFIYKKKWLDHLYKMLVQLNKDYKNIVLSGDFNIAPDNIDCHDPAIWKGKNLVSDIERQYFNKIISSGFIDSFRHLNPEAIDFSIKAFFNIKLVFFGENGEAEYSGDPRVFALKGMPFEDWNEQYFKGAGIQDIINIGLEKADYFSEKDFDESDLTFYRPPNISEMQDKGIIFRWFAYYHNWTPQENYYYCRENIGFEPNTERSEGTYSKYASLDDKIDGYHYFLSVIKFGIGRTTSDAAHEIRDGKITREEGVALVERFDGEFPTKYYSEFLEYCDITDETFHAMIDSWRSDHLWRKTSNGWELKHAAWHDDHLNEG